MEEDHKKAQKPCMVCRTRDRQTTFFKFPSNPEMRKAWCRKLGIQESNVKSGLRVCADHFAKNEIHQSGTRLKKTAIPSLLKRKAPKVPSAPAFGVVDIAPKVPLILPFSSIVPCVPLVATTTMPLGQQFGGTMLSLVEPASSSGMVHSHQMNPVVVSSSISAAANLKRRGPRPRRMQKVAEIETMTGAMKDCVFCGRGSPERLTPQNESFETIWEYIDIDVRTTVESRLGFHGNGEDLMKSPSTCTQCSEIIFQMQSYHDEIQRLKEKLAEQAARLQEVIFNLPQGDHGDEKVDPVVKEEIFEHCDDNDEDWKPEETVGREEESESESEKEEADMIEDCNKKHDLGDTAPSDPLAETRSDNSRRREKPRRSRAAVNHLNDDKPNHCEICNEPLLLEEEDSCQDTQSVISRRRYVCVNKNCSHNPANISRKMTTLFQSLHYDQQNQDPPRRRICYRPRILGKKSNDV